MIKSIYILILVIFSFSKISAQESLPSKALKIETQILQWLQDPNGKDNFDRDLKIWNEIVGQLKANPSILQAEIENYRQSLLENINSKSNHQEYKILLDQWNKLSELNVKLELEQTFLPDKMNSPTPLPELIQNANLDAAGNKFDTQLDTPSDWDLFRSSVLNSVKNSHPDFAFIYSGATGSEILASAKTFAIERLRLAAYQEMIELKLLGQISKADMENQIAPTVDESGLNLAIGKIANTQFLRTSSALNTFEIFVRNSLMNRRFRVTNQTLFSQSRSIGLKMHLVPVMWMAEALDIAQMLKDPFEANIRLAFDFTLRKFLKELLAVSSFATYTDRDLIAEQAFLALKTALRTYDNQMFLTTLVRSYVSTMTPSGHSDVKANLPISKKWHFYLDFIPVIKSYLHYSNGAVSLSRIAEKVQVKNSCEQFLDSPIIR